MYCVFKWDSLEQSWIELRCKSPWQKRFLLAFVLSVCVLKHTVKDSQPRCLAFWESKQSCPPTPHLPQYRRGHGVPCLLKMCRQEHSHARWAVAAGWFLKDWPGSEKARKQALCWGMEKPWKWRKEWWWEERRICNSLDIKEEGKKWKRNSIPLNRNKMLHDICNWTLQSNVRLKGKTKASVSQTFPHLGETNQTR